MTELGWTEYLLPSRGVLYKGKLPGGRVELRPMSAKQQAMLQTQGGGVIGKLDALVDTCCRLAGVRMEPGEKPFTHKDLLLTDRFAILLALRTKTYGPEYTFRWQCKSCGKHSNSTINIIDELNEKMGIEGQTVEPIEVKLTDRGTTLKLRFLRGNDEEQVARNSKRVEMQSNDASDPSYLYRIALQLESQDDQPFKDIVEKQRFIEGLTARDLITIEDTVTDAETGIDSRLYLDCPRCEASNVMVMPFSAEFFRPRSNRGGEGDA